MSSESSSDGTYSSDSESVSSASDISSIPSLTAASSSSGIARVPVRDAPVPATPAPRPPAQLVMGGPLPRQPARVASDPELVVGTDPEMEHPPAVTPN